MLHHPLARMLAASLAMFLPLALTFALIEPLIPKGVGVSWPNLVGALVAALGYWTYVNRVERREMTELSGTGAAAEWALGAALGVLLGLLRLAPLWGAGGIPHRGSGRRFSAPRVDPRDGARLRDRGVADARRGVPHRRAGLGQPACAVFSTVLFVAAHLPGEISLMGVLVTAAASLAFTAAYQVSRRLWLPMGMHFAWNYLFSAWFSVTVSGHAAKGWLQGSMTGPEWLSGGSYGVEASAVALLAWAAASALLLRRAYTCGRFMRFCPARRIASARKQAFNGKRDGK